MATKKKTKTAAKKTTSTVLNSAPVANFADFTKGFQQFTQFPKFADFDQFKQFQQFPSFQSFKMENPMLKGNKQVEQLAQDAAAMGQDQINAIMKSSAIFAKGMEDIMKTCMEIAAEAGEKSQSVAKSVMSCKTLNEFTEVQTKLAQASFDDFMTNATRISEKGVKLCTEAFEPINDQVGKAIKKAADAAAA